ncbi:MAG: 50S ribosomal protein L18 [Candidatus Eisenbacteria bacterium]|nr:50S ribosomal protein L18 [Candidatus Eisenbacteria bacterium]
MRTSLSESALARIKRHRRIRRKLQGTAEVPRLCVFRSAKHIYAQVIDDEQGRSLCTASTLSKEIVPELGGMRKMDQSKKVGMLVARLAREKGIERVAFDRGGYLYHGRVKALAEGAREGGLKF